MFRWRSEPSHNPRSKMDSNFSKKKAGGFLAELHNLKFMFLASYQTHEIKNRCRYSSRVYAIRTIFVTKSHCFFQVVWSFALKDQSVAKLLCRFQLFHIASARLYCYRSYSDNFTFAGDSKKKMLRKLELCKENQSN